MKAALHQYLAAQSTVTALVPAARIQRGAKRSAGAGLPAILYRRISGRDDDCQEGASGLASTRFRFEVWAATEPEAEAIRVALRDVLHGLQHTTIGTGANQVHVQGGAVVANQDDTDWPEDGTDPADYCCWFDWRAWYEVTVPSYS